ncbi:MAG: hypothetical protein ACREUD_04435, partial [Gammaproteobacteria bacterium]
MSVKDLFGKSTLAVAVSAAQKLASRDVFPPNNVSIRARCWEQEQGSASPQNIHVEPTSRLGGAAVFLAYVVAVAVALKLELMPLHLPLPLLISALPVLVVGLWEDIARRVCPTHRLLAAFVSAALATALAAR